jgi:PhnB protein
MEPTIYLFFKGDCLEAMTHYAEVLGGEIVGVFRNADAPDPEAGCPAATTW